MLEEIFKERTYKENVLNSWFDIIMKNKQISEKDFHNQKILKDIFNKFINSQYGIDNLINEFEHNKLRYEYCAEHLYSKYIFIF